MNINGNQSVGTLSATILGGDTTGTLNITAGSTLRVNQAVSADFAATLNIAAGTITTFGTFAMQGPNMLEIDAPPTLGANSVIAVNGGTLRFNLSGTAATIGSGVTVTVASAATLQLAGSVSALSGGGLANIVNNGSTLSGGGLLVTGTHQSVGEIIGTASQSGPTTYTGDTIVGSAGSAASLTATQILQNTLTINAGSTVTIAPAASTPRNGVSASAAAATSTDPFTGILESVASGAPTTVTSAKASRQSTVNWPQLFRASMPLRRTMSPRSCRLDFQRSTVRSIRKHARMAHLHQRPDHVGIADRRVIISQPRTNIAFRRRRCVGTQFAG